MHEAGAFKPVRRAKAMRNFWRFWMLLSVASAGGLASGDARADGMRCNNRIVSTGDSLHRVRSICGAPADAQRRVATRTEKRKSRGPCASRSARTHACERVEEYSIDVVIDEWTYDFGRYRFVHYLTFIDGKLASVETGSYGSGS